VDRDRGARWHHRPVMILDTIALEQVIEAARAAGEVVLDEYERGAVKRHKSDGSPVCGADERSQEVILTHLGELAPDIPAVAEEGAQPSLAAPDELFWLVDPLDGTKEFLDRTDEFTVNIALIEDRAPVLGVVLAPARDLLFAAAPGIGASLEDREGRRSILARSIPSEGATVVSSRSHGDREALARFAAGRRVARTAVAGSSLKFCLLAAGEADLYPRFGRTMEWDTAAGDAVLRAAGGRVTDLEGRPLAYGKPGFENPHFIAWGRG
jgi:3'(2'), 5'-bisphosphate nucleotidase